MACGSHVTTHEQCVQIRSAPTLPRVVWVFCTRFRRSECVDRLGELCRARTLPHRPSSQRRCLAAWEAVRGSTEGGCTKEKKQVRRGAFVNDSPLPRVTTLWRMPIRTAAYAVCVLAFLLRANCSESETVERYDENKRYNKCFGEFTFQSLRLSHHVLFGFSKRSLKLFSVQTIVCG